MPESISQVAVSPEMFGKIEDSYSADRISEGIVVRKPAIFEGKLYLATGLNAGEAEAYQLVPAEEFTGGRRTYNIPKGREYEEYYESLREDPNGFYHGMLVKRGAHEHALVGPPILFVVKARTRKKTNHALVTRPPGLKILGAPFELYPTGLTVIGKPTIEEYTEAFKRLQLMEGAIHWWYGDLCLAYEGHYHAITDIAEQSGFDVGTIYNDKWVASRYEVSYRYETLTFKHHLIAAPLDDRLEWLKRAEAGDKPGKPWSTRQLEAEIHKAKRLPLPPGKFTVIYADPPWQYEFSQSESRSIEAHYGTMAVEEISQVPIPTDKDAILFLWATNPKIREALQVIEAWGFLYRTNMAWVKDKWGMGYYTREQHELLLIARKGDLVPPDEEDRVSSVINLAIATDETLNKWPELLPRLGHSQKPETVYEIIEKMYPHQKYIELFAREKRPGWESWGLELNGQVRKG